MRRLSAPESQVRRYSDAHHLRAGCSRESVFRRLFWIQLHLGPITGGAAYDDTDCGFPLVRPFRLRLSPPGRGRGMMLREN